MSRKFFCPSFDPATSSSWITSVATGAKQSANSSARSAPNSSSCPKYSPDLNPIEQVFAKLKHLLRKAAARTVDAVCAAIGQALDAFTPEECANKPQNFRLSNLMLSRFSSRSRKISIAARSRFSLTSFPVFAGDSSLRASRPSRGYFRSPPSSRAIAPHSRPRRPASGLRRVRRKHIPPPVSAAALPEARSPAEKTRRVSRRSGRNRTAEAAAPRRAV